MYGQTNKLFAMERKILNTGMMVFAISGAIFLTSCNQSSQTEESTDTEVTSENNEAEKKEEEKSKEEIPSPRRQSAGEVSGVAITVDYGSPAVKGREIWGGLEDYDKVWRAGANETTSIEFASDVIIDGTEVPAGKYGFFLIPKEEGAWVAILNSKVSWGSNDYDEANDVLRINVNPEWADEVQERLEYSVDSGSITFAWEKVRLQIPVEKAE